MCGMGGSDMHQAHVCTHTNVPITGDQLLHLVQQLHCKNVPALVLLGGGHSRGREEAVDCPQLDRSRLVLPTAHKELLTIRHC